jgi:hypothetical protein
MESATLIYCQPELSDSIGSQEPSSYNIKEKSKQAISTQWVKTFLVIPAKAGIQDSRYFWIPAFAGMTSQQKIAQFRVRFRCSVKVRMRFGCSVGLLVLSWVSLRSPQPTV